MVRPLPILAAETSLGTSLRALKPALVENNDIIEWVDWARLSSASLRRNGVFMASVLMALFQSRPWLPWAPLPPFPPSLSPEVMGLQKTGSLHISFSCISLPGEGSRWAKGYNGCIILGMVSFSKHPLSEERKGKSGKGRERDSFGGRLEC